MTQLKSNRELSRGILRRYMADYTNQRTPPKQVKGGFYGVLMCDTGEVWLGETKNFSSALNIFNGRTTSTADCIKQARARGSDLEMWLLTQPSRFSAQELENELYEAGLLASRKEVDKTGGGGLYSIRHRSTQAYFVLTNRRADLSEASLLNNFYARLVNMAGNSRNERLSSFITEQATDILNQRGFDIVHICNFKDRDEEYKKRQEYIDNCTYGVNLNLKAVD